MKTTSILAVALLLASSQAAKVVQRDIALDYEENVQTTEEEQQQDLKFNKLKTNYQSHMEQNSKLI